MGIKFCGKEKYTIVVDYGKPYTIKVETEEQIKKELKNLRELYEKGEDVNVYIYDENNNDVTSEILKKYR